MSPAEPDQEAIVTTSKPLLDQQVTARSVCCALLLLCVAGCASLGRRGRAPEEVAACRELSRQGAAAMEAGHWVQAETVLRRAAELSPTDADAHRYLAEALWHRGAADEALEQIEEAVNLDSSDAPLAVRAGEMWQSVGRPEQALSQAERAIRLDPNLANAWALRGRVFWQLGQLDRALADLQRALQFAPDNAGLLQDVAALYRQRGQPARALATLHHLLDTYPPGEEPQLPLMLEGQTLVELGRPAQAAAALARASRRGPPNVEVYFQLAEAQMAAGEHVAASASAQQALALDGSHEASRQLLVRLAGQTAPDDPSRR